MNSFAAAFDVSMIVFCLISMAADLLCVLFSNLHSLFTVPLELPQGDSRRAGGIIEELTVQLEIPNRKANPG